MFNNHYRRTQQTKINNFSLNFVRSNFKHIHMKTISFFVIFIFLAYTSSIGAQVTIGSHLSPHSGALLDLKQQEAAVPGGVTANRGLGIPRVELKALDKLIMGSTIINKDDNGGNQYEEHVGLLVFNISEESPFCPGLYLWNGTQWIALMGACSGLKISPTTPLLFPSGQDLRTLVGKSITVKWDPATGVISFNDNTNNKQNNASYAKVVLTDANAFSPSVSSLVNATGETLTITPQPMSASELNDYAGNPFRTRESKFSLTMTDNNKESKSNEIVINQTNKALLSDGKYVPYVIKEHNGNSINEIRDFQITSNAKWKLKGLYPADATNAFTEIKLFNKNGQDITNEIEYGEELDNNTHADPVKLQFRINMDATRAFYSKLIFTDANPDEPQRFSDLVYNIYQCSNIGAGPAMNGWAEMAGYPNVKDKKEYNLAYAADAAQALAEDQAAGIGDIHPVTGISWHRDQDGNVFLAASFHYDSANPTDFSKERWMLTNLAATTYAQGVQHSQGREILYKMNLYGARNVASYAYTHSIANSGSTTLSDVGYLNNPRIGAVYTWDAATAGKGGSNGAVSYPTDGGNINQTRVQGICPNGWYLPSDADYTDLENEIIKNTHVYSKLDDLDEPAISYSATKDRGIKHGLALQESCAHKGTIYQGESNGISTLERPGFDLVLAGEIDGKIDYFNTGASLWTSSGDLTAGAWIRFVLDGKSSVRKVDENRSKMFSIRCKQNM